MCTRSEGTTFLKYKIPTRGLLGLRNAILTVSRGTAILNTIFDSYGPWAGDITTRDQGSLVSSDLWDYFLYSICGNGFDVEGFWISFCCYTYNRCYVIDYFILIYALKLLYCNFFMYLTILLKINNLNNCEG